MKLEEENKVAQYYCVYCAYYVYSIMYGWRLVFTGWGSHFSGSGRTESNAERRLAEGWPAYEKFSDRLA